MYINALNERNGQKPWDIDTTESNKLSQKINHLDVCCTLPYCVCLFVYLFVCLSICLSACLSVCLSVYLFVCLSICLSVCLLC